MDEEALKKVFVKFLIDNGCLFQFIENSKQRWESIDDLLSSGYPINCMIGYAFHWINTKEGFHFWETVDLKWKAQI